jgi:ABC-type branched-subunit amino acid transport system ATPase component/predicted MFS family arabinose efflux permease
MADDEVTQSDRPGSLAGAILDLEAERRAAHDERDAVAEDVLPGVSDEQLTLKDALRMGGTLTFATLAVLSAMVNLESAVLGTLAPDIRDSLRVSNGTIVFISAAAGGFLIVGSLPMGWLADRKKRGRTIALANLLFAAMVVVSGLAVNAVMLVVARLGVGIARSNEFTVQGSLMADQYPIQTRGRVSAALSIAGRVTGTLSPLLVGGLATAIGGPSAWRWVFIILALPVAAVSLSALRLPEPPRGQYEKKDIIGEVIEDEHPLPISMEAAFARLLQIKTLKSVIMAFAALGFGLFTVPILGNLFMEDQYGLGSFGRGAVGTTGGVALLATIPFVAKYYDSLYRRDPAKALRLVGQLILPSAVLVPVQYFMPNAVLFAILGVPSAVLMGAAFGMVGPIMAGVVPYRLRGMGAALGSVYIFFVGATGGALISAVITNAYNTRTAVIVLSVPSTLLGGWFLIRGAHSVRGDLALVTAEIREELDEHDRRMADPATVPALQVRHVDFSYGQVQILFDVNFDVKDGEVLALLGTNGAGKSTILRVIAGLGTPGRGVVRQSGRSITFVSPEMRSRLGIAMLPGGKGVFNDMSVRENLVMAAYNQRADRAEMERSIESTLELFPELKERPNELASSLSGGQQQLLALAGVLTTNPKILIIDELSLGLAPIMVERVVGIVRELKARGLTIIVVEQSLNVAMSIADRAVFLEKGHVRFEGAMKDLVERDDLARAVFLGAEGG